MFWTLPLFSRLDSVIGIIFLGLYANEKELYKSNIELQN